ncbi:hypothetical protein NCAS_0A12220 [Naumovozyma castellii]|uniref:LicD/FKTN/FKRP nucleotidyltransferase domain-containing protein n=1 Tax=Naumovozyma castellii TaxID=27288 RepID=G0V8I2_NAUCA|nr:hypothetical protein NCAS_0A12220 [Naumovozyma castellii CBS 4309]CCC67780.1 hypothetical protein NCAS_0A12220 [Naumovozyma castellii CBS 4309]
MIHRCFSMIPHLVFNTARKLKRKNYKHLILTLVAFLLLFFIYTDYYESTSRTALAVLKATFAIFQTDDIELGTKIYKKLRFDTSPTWIDEYELQKDLLTIKIGPNQGKTLTSIDELEFYDSDPRIIWSVYLKYLTNENEMDSGLPFSWYDWADFHDYNKLIASKDSNLSCSFIFETAFDLEKLKSLERDLSEPLFTEERAKYNDPFWYKNARKLSTGADMTLLPNHCTDNKSSSWKFNTPFVVTDLYDKMRPEVYDFHTRNYILNTLSAPLSLTFLNSDQDCFRIILDQTNRSNMIESGLLAKYLASEEDVNEVIFDHHKVYGEFLTSPQAETYKINIEGTNKNVYNDELVHLNPDDFDFDVNAKIHELETRLDTLSVHDVHYLESLKTSVATHPALARKYFSEARNLQQVKGLGHHRDKTFFYKNMDINSQEYANRLNSMIRTFQKFVKANGLISWLAHGTLFGYLYNGETFPWDNDFDLQMPIKHLHYMSQYFNQSLILEDPREGNGRFLLDVGDSLTIREKGNGDNNIDARFIDIDSGVYIDITGLSVSPEPFKSNIEPFIDANEFNETKSSLQDITSKMESNQEENGNSLATMTLANLLNYAKDHSEDFDKDTVKLISKTIKSEENEIKAASNLLKNLDRKQRLYMNRKFHVYNCRNRHFTTLGLLSPLINTNFHGVTALIPHQHISILRDEYKLPEKFGFLTFEGRVFLPELKYWLNFPILKKVANLNNGNANLPKLQSPLNAPSFSELYLLYSNAIRLGFHDLFGILFSSFDVTTYRLKELEIQYDETLDIEEKLRLLSLMRDKAAPTLKSPGKDPYTYNYETRMWNSFSKNVVDKNSVDNIREYVDFFNLDKLWRQIEQLEQRSLNMLKIENDDGGKVDLNKYGLNLFTGETKMDNHIFKYDHMNITSPVVN